MKKGWISGLVPKRQTVKEEESPKTSEHISHKVWKNIKKISLNKIVSPLLTPCYKSGMYYYSVDNWRAEGQTQLLLAATHCRRVKLTNTAKMHCTLGKHSILVEGEASEGLYTLLLKPFPWVWLLPGCALLAGQTKTNNRISLEEAWTWT